MPSEAQDLLMLISATLTSKGAESLGGKMLYDKNVILSLLNKIEKELER